MLGSVVLFLVVFALNAIPAFAPPTWMVLSFVGFRYPQRNMAVTVLIAAVAAATGRFLLATMSKEIIRKKLLSESSRRNVDAIRERLEGRQKLTFAVFLFYAFTPLPSNYLFIAYGLTGMKLAPIVLPFLLGRFVSYTFWGVAGTAVARSLTLESTEALSYLGIYFIATQVLFLSIIYAFTRVDWRALFNEKKFRWMKNGTNGTNPGQ